jgi:hypothetical protein
MVTLSRSTGSFICFLDLTMSQHPTNKQATLHMEMSYHFCRQHTELGNVLSVLKPTSAMVADFISKQTIRETHVRHALRSFSKQDVPIELAPIHHLVA